VGLQRRQVVVPLGDRRQQALAHRIVVLLEAPDLREIALPGRVDLGRARERFEKLRLTQVVHRRRSVAAHLDLLEVALGRQAEQAFRDLRLAGPDGERDVDGRERVVAARQTLELVEQLLAIDLRTRIPPGPSKGALPTRMAALEAHLGYSPSVPRPSVTAKSFNGLPYTT
jgi:hypothetical protein